MTISRPRRDIARLPHIHQAGASTMVMHMRSTARDFVRTLKRSRDGRAKYASRRVAARITR
jgi:hypothetical protein